MSYYVAATDKFMSGWGKAEGKINRLIFVCENRAEQEIVFENCCRREDFKQVRKCCNLPHYDSRKYYAQIKTKEDYPYYYISRYF